jgi:membrane-associated phospholipid phosphatase
MPRRAAFSVPASPQRLALVALTGAMVATALLFLTWVLAFHVGAFARADRSVLGGFADLDRPRVDAIATFIADLCNPKPYVYLAGALVAIAAARRRPGLALVIALIVFGANFTTQLLKPGLAAPRPVPAGVQQIGSSAWPSGHATAAMALALCLVLAVPARLRPAAAALGAAFAVAVSFSFLIMSWHFPSDVFGGFLVATVWTLLGIAALSWFRSRRDEPVVEVRRRTSIKEALRPPAAAVLGALALAGIVALARPHAVVSYAQAHTAFVVGAGAIAALGLTLVTGVMLALRR